MRGGPILSNGSESYRNELATDRAVVWAGHGRREGLLSGGEVTRNTVELAVDIAPFEALVQAVVGSTPMQQGWHVWSDVTETVPLGAPDASSRIDAVVCAVRDPGTPRWVVVPGTPSANPVAPDDSTIEGHEDVTGATNGWWRLCNVQVDPGDATLKAGSVTGTAPWAGEVFFAAWHSATTRQPGVDAPIVWSNVVEVSGGASMGGAGVITLPAGLYDVQAAVTGDTSSGINSNTSWYVEVQRNGSMVARAYGHDVGFGLDTATIAKTLRLDAPGTLQVRLTNHPSTQGTLSTLGGQGDTYVTISRRPG